MSLLLAAPATRDITHLILLSTVLVCMLQLYATLDQGLTDLYNTASQLLSYPPTSLQCVLPSTREIPQP